MKFKITNEKPISELPEGFYYIGQDNYYIVNLNAPNSKYPEKYLYSDSATSCIIVVVEGKDADNNPIVALSHLSRPERFEAFFEIVAKNFSGAVSIFAQGANPPFPAYKSGEYTYTSLINSQIVINWVNNNIYVPQSNVPVPTWYIEQCTFSLGLGDPQQDDRGCYGIDLETMTVSNQRFILTDEQRDPTGGVQTLFCVFGLQIGSQKIVLHKADEDFTFNQIKLLVLKAKENNWTDILYMTKDEVLNKYSSTPKYEAPWFFATMRQSAEYVKNYSQWGE